jgi:class 3 adenylate cyclase/ABC-type glycerol-3-phosphate transport system substrate-binding protein
MYNNRIYGLPIDMDPILMYYRRDLTPRPPDTWEDLLVQVKRFHMKDLNQDGIPDAGMCMMVTDSIPIAMATSIYKYENGYRKGPFFDANIDDKTPMEAMFTTDGWRYIYSYIRELYNYSHWVLPDIRNNPNLTFGIKNDGFGFVSPMFAAGRCAFMISLTSTGTFVVQKPNVYSWGRQGTARTPGSPFVFDRKTHKLTPCDPNLCPNQEAGGVNRPATVIGGAVLVVNKNTKNMDLAINFISWASTKIDVRRFGGINPFRKYQLNATYFTEAKSIGFNWDLADAQFYVGALQEVLDQTNAYPAPRIPILSDLQGSFSRAIREVCRLAEFVNATSDVPAIVDSMDAYWRQQMTEKGISYRKVEDVLRRSLGLPPLVDPKPDPFPYWVIAIIIVALMIPAYVAYRQGRRAMVVKHAPKSTPCGISFVSIKGLAAMWETWEAEMPAALDRFSKIVLSACNKNGVYVVKRIGDNFMLAATDSICLVRAAGQIQTELQAVTWTTMFSPEAREARSESATERGSRRSSRRSTESKRSTKSKLTTATGRDQTYVSEAERGIRVGISIAHGDGVVDYNAEANTYDYRGPVVEEAAIVADTTFPWQTVLTETAQNAVFSSLTEADGTLQSLGSWRIRSRDVDLFQFTPAGGKVVSTAALSASEWDTSVVDSVAAALDQQNKSLAEKKITVAVIDIAGFQASAGTLTKEGFQDKYNELYSEVDAIVTQEKGVVVSFYSGRFFIAFNAFSATPGQVKRAAKATLEICNAARQLGYSRATAGLAGGLALCGTLPSRSGTHTGVVGACVHRAAMLERLCATFADEAIDCLTSAELVSDLNTCAYTQLVDILELPSPVVGGSGVRKEPLYALMDLRPEGGSDEWMYDMEKAEKSDPFHLINTAFNLYLNGKEEEARQMLARRPEGLEHAVDAVGAQQLNTIMSTQGYVSPRTEYARVSS